MYFKTSRDKTLNDLDKISEETFKFKNKCPKLVEIPKEIPRGGNPVRKLGGELIFFMRIHISGIPRPTCSSRDRLHGEKMFQFD